MPKYNPKTIEPKWQDYWFKNKTFKATKNLNKQKYYALDMFPYPSGSGMHVGHPEGYTATDIICRYKRMNNFNVLHPIGWDAYGLPAEQHAIQTGQHPKITTENNILNFIRQLKSLGFSYDWDREINTTDPKYFKWTQWIFKQFFNHFYCKESQKARSISELKIPTEIGKNSKAKQEYIDSKRLAYLDKIPVWWCPSLGTVLANEEVINGLSERGNHSCERRPLKQWMLRITEYSDRLIEDLGSVDWPESVKHMQYNWIGRSEGATVHFYFDHFSETISVFTTRPDTLFGISYLVIAPEHPLVKTITTQEYQKDMEFYCQNTLSLSELERGIDKEKTGIFTGSFVTHPLTQEKIPVWVSNYVMMNYGTGAVMAVPAHDQRDYEFAKKFNLPILPVIEGGDVSQKAHTGDGVLIYSDFLNGFNVSKAKKIILEHLSKAKLGEHKVQYKLRDWLFSRQRYWGEPFPIVHTKNGLHVVSDQELPVLLPDLEDFSPSYNMEPPLSKDKDWIRYNHDSIEGIRETNTMPQWAGSCWYFLRYLDPNNQNTFCDAQEEQYWMPVDLYIGGAEHAVLHLLYSRFWYKFLKDINCVHYKEPFNKLINQGLILGENGEKMSKSIGNIVSPDDIVKQYGADAMRIYEMFMGPLERAKPWNTSGLEGPVRFLHKLWRYIIGENETPNVITQQEIPKKLLTVLHKTIQKVTLDIEKISFNTAIAQMMILSNQLHNYPCIHEVCEIIAKLISPFAPHIAEEFWERLGNTESITYQPWPEFKEENLIQNTTNIVFQTNGKVRSQIEVQIDLPKEELIELAKQDSKIQSYFEVNKIVKVIVVLNKLVNFVLKPKK